MPGNPPTPSDFMRLAESHEALTQGHKRLEASQSELGQKFDRMQGELKLNTDATIRIERQQKANIGAFNDVADNVMAVNDAQARIESSTTDMVAAFGVAKKGFIVLGNIGTAIAWCARWILKAAKWGLPVTGVLAALKALSWWPFL